MNFEIRYLKSVRYQFYNESSDKRLKLSKITVKKRFPRISWKPLVDVW